MAAKKIITVGLKKLEYADALSTGIPTTWTDIDVVHEDTFDYSVEAGTEEQYINELDGQPYHIDGLNGTPLMNFSIGKYDLEMKAEFFGGTYTAASASANESWTPSDTGESVYKAFRATTKDDVVIVFPKARVTPSHTRNIKALGLTLQARPIKLDSSTPLEKWEVDNTKTA